MSIPRLHRSKQDQIIEMSITMFSDCLETRVAERVRLYIKKNNILKEFGEVRLNQEHQFVFSGKLKHAGNLVVVVNPDKDDQEWFILRQNESYDPDWEKSGDLAPPYLLFPMPDDQIASARQQLQNKALLQKTRSPREFGLLEIETKIPKAPPTLLPRPSSSDALLSPIVPRRKSSV